MLRLHPNAAKFTRMKHVNNKISIAHPRLHFGHRACIADNFDRRMTRLQCEANCRHANRQQRRGFDSGSPFAPHVLAALPWPPHERQCAPTFHDFAPMGRCPISARFPLCFVSDLSRRSRSRWSSSACMRAATAAGSACCMPAWGGGGGGWALQVVDSVGDRVVVAWVPQAVESADDLGVEQMPECTSRHL